jgi:hypothetical protein
MAGFDREGKGLSLIKGLGLIIEVNDYNNVTPLCTLQSPCSHLVHHGTGCGVIIGRRLQSMGVGVLNLSIRS